MESNIMNNEAARLAYAIAGYEHKPVEEIVTAAMREYARLVLPEGQATNFIEAQKNQRPLKERIAEIQARVAALPILDHRTPEEIIGYDEHGSLPHGD